MMTNDSTAPGLAPDRVWDTSSACAELLSAGLADGCRTALRQLRSAGLLPHELTPDGLRDELGRRLRRLVLDCALESAGARRRLILFAQLHALIDGGVALYANDSPGKRHWVVLARGKDGDPAAMQAALAMLRRHLGEDLLVLAHAELVALLRVAPEQPGVEVPLAVYAPVLRAAPTRIGPRQRAGGHLRRLEDESIDIIREAVAEARNPVMLYSIGKDSSVMLHLACKAFYPAPPPFPLLHVDTRWKFQEMYLFRDHMARVSGMELLVHVNPEAVARDINPFDHGSALHTDITKTAGLKQALDKWRFDVVFGGARRDEEKSRAKERIFSFRDAHHGWDPKNQRPELWNLYNTRKGPGESIRVFPLSNWTELAYSTQTDH